MPGWASMLAVPRSGTALRCTGQLRWLRNSRPAGTQTCSPSPCLQQRAKLAFPARLRRQQGAPPDTASALVAPLAGCTGCWAKWGHHVALFRMSLSDDVLCRYAAMPLCRYKSADQRAMQPWHGTSGAMKGLGRHLAGRLVDAEQRSGEVGARSALRCLACRGCLNAAVADRVVSSPAPPCREHRREAPQSGAAKMAPTQRPTQPAPCAIPTKRPTPKLNAPHTPSTYSSPPDAP